MFTNYQYFLTLAEECNISRAASRLYITHQCLSKYLSKLEAECGVALFTRKPSLTLTPAGIRLAEAMRRVEAEERNMKDLFTELREEGGEIRLGTTEGRFRILMPGIMTAFKEQFPRVRLRIFGAPSPELRSMILSNQLDMMVAGLPPKPLTTLTSIEVLQERLYLVISDNMLRERFSNDFPHCKEDLRRGADLRLFQDVPFALNLPFYNSSLLIERHLNELGIELNCIHTSSNPDLHHMMSARDYAASFCLTMYLPQLLKLERTANNELNVFPIKDFRGYNPVAISFAKNRIFSRYGKALLQMIRQQCQVFRQYDLP